MLMDDSTQEVAEEVGIQAEPGDTSPENRKRKLYDSDGVETTVNFVARSAVSHLKDTDGEFFTKERVETWKFSEDLMSNLSKDQQNGCCCDVVLLVESRRFPAHKSVLKAKSSYFTAMFSGNFQESSVRDISLKDVPENSFQVIVDFVYGRPLDITWDNVHNVYVSADMFCMDSLRLECRRRLPSLWNASKLCRYDPELCVAYLTMFYDLSLKMGLGSFHSLLLPTFKREVLKSANCREILLELPLRLFLSLVSLVSDDSSWNVAKQINWLLFSLDWTAKDPANRVKVVTTLTLYVGLQHVPKDVLNYVLGRIVTFCVELGEEDKSRKHIVKRMRKVFEKGGSTVPGSEYRLCAFSQDPVTLEVDLRVFEKGQWLRKTFNLEVKIVQCVQVRDELVLLHERGFYLIDLLDYSLVYKEVHHLKRFQEGFVACCQNERLLIAGKSTFKNSKKEVIIVCDFYYWKPKPSLVQLFFFKSSENKVISMSSNKDAVFVLTVNLTLPTSAILCVKHNYFMGYHTIDRYPLGENSFESRLFLNYNTNEHLFLMDTSGPQKSLFEGIVVYLFDCPEVCDVWDKISHLKEEKETPWIGVVNGSFVSSCPLSQGGGHLILASQDGHLLVILMKNLHDFQIVETLPRFSPDLPKVDFAATNFLLKSCTPTVPT